MADVIIKMRPEGDVEVALGVFLGGRFGAYRQACANAGAAAVKLASGSWVNRLPLASVPALLAGLQGFTLDVAPAAAQALRSEADAARTLVDEGEQRLALAERRLVGTGLSLFHFQKGGVRWLAPRKAALLADEMGLGKTVQALLAMPERAAAVVVAPAAVLLSWRAEAARWRPDLTATLLRSSAAWRWPSPGEVCICTYGVLPRADAELPPAPEGAVLLADEAHLLKNRKTARAREWNALRDRVVASNGRVWLLTGTPLVNRPPELWNVLDAAGLAKECFGSWGRFVGLFHGRHGQWGGYEWDASGISDEVPALLQRVSLHRRRADVLPDLPAKRRVVREVNDLPASAIKACDAAVDALRKRGIDLDKLGPDADLGRLIVGDAFELISCARAQLASAKIPAALEIVESFEEAEEPLVVVSAHREPVDTIAARPGWAAITGDTSPEDRGEVCRRFQAGELRGVALTYRAGGVGITLTRAAHMLMIDLDWTPALCSQAEDRICRIGQKRGCLVTQLVASHPLDKRVCELLREKQAIIDASVEASAVEASHVHSDPAAALAQAAEQAAQAVAVAPPPAPPERRGPFGPRDIVLAPQDVVGKFRGPATPEEVHAARALLTLAGLDPDHAGLHNNVGFNAQDTTFGHSLASAIREHGRLSDCQWPYAVRIVVKYHRQVGRA